MTRSQSRIGAADIATIAWVLVDRHGERAPVEAERVISELEDEGEAFSAQCWRILKTMVEDALAGRMARGTITLH
jgi:hypothetical protein